MDTREFPVLDADDEPHIDRLAAGIGDEPARVFVYLCRRASRPDIDPTPATQIEIQIGTDLSRKAIQDAIGVLTDRNLVETTTVETTTAGRPPNVWKPHVSLSRATDRTYLNHAIALLEQAAEISGVDGGDVDIDTVQTATETTPLSIGLNWDPNGLQLPFYAALNDQCYSDRGLDLEQRVFNGSRRTVEAVVSGDVTVGIAGAATVTRALADDVPIVPVAALFQRPMVVVYTIRNVFGKPLTQADQLRGHRVGMPIPSETSTLGHLFLSQANVLDDVEVVDVGGEEDDALQSGKVDAVTGMFADPMRLDAAGEAVDSLHVAGQYPIYGPTLIVAEQTLRDDREKLAKFLAGTTAGWAKARQDPSDAARRVANADTDPEWIADIFERAVAEFGTTDAVSRHGWGWLSPETWNRLEIALAQSDLLEGNP